MMEQRNEQGHEQQGDGFENCFLDHGSGKSGPPLHGGMPGQGKKKRGYGTPASIIMFRGYLPSAVGYPFLIHSGMPSLNQNRFL